jgi:hypothetical protein
MLWMEMHKMWHRWFALGMLGLVLWGGAPRGCAETPNTLVWHWQQNRVDADITSWDLRLLLEHVATATGWRIYLDPAAAHTVSAKFKNLPVGEALHSMLGNVNFVVIPQTNGPSRLYVFRTSQRQATSLIAPIVKTAQPVPNELVVTLKPNSKTKIEDLARAYNAKIIGRMDSQNAYLLQFADDAATQLARQQLALNPDVASVDNNYPIDAPPTPVSADNSLPNLTLNPKTNDGNCQLVVGLIDTAVQPLPANMNSFLLPQINVTGDAQPPANQLTHGTAMATTIIDSIAKTEGSTSVKIQPVNVYGGSETTTSFDVASGIIQAVNHGANIINLSLGGTGDSQVLHNAIIQVAQQGIPIYAAAGNEPVTTPTYPAAYPEVISVTATDNTGHIASYANRGSFIDMTAPGDNVVGFNGQSYLVEGTSTSTAFATGAAAGLADASHVCADQAEGLLQRSLPHAAILKTTP